MKTIWRRVALAGLLAALALPASAQEVALGPGTLTSRALTVYQGDLALVHERHRAPLPAGAATLTLAPVPEGLLPETARFGGAGLRVSGHRLETATLSEAALLRASVGKTIGLVRVNPATGARSVVDARVLSVRDGVVLEVEGKVLTGARGPFRFDAVPGGLRPAPALLADAAVDEGATGEVEVLYLTTGLSWRADYSAELSPDETRLAIKGFVTLENRSGVDYTADLVRAVAGDVNRVSVPRPAMRALAMESAAADAAPPVDTAGAYHLYTLAGAATLPAGGSVQRMLLELPQLAVRKVYVLEGAAPVRPLRGPAGAQRQPLSVVLRFKNPRAEDGGVPMPGGTVRVYGPGLGGPVFLGEDRVRHTPVGDEVRLTLGAAFDVTADRRQTDYLQRGGDRVFEVAHEITLRNARPVAAVVDVIEFLPGDWEILESSARHTKTAANTAAWSVPVPARGETVLTYRALIRQ